MEAGLIRGNASESGGGTGPYDAAGFAQGCVSSVRNALVSIFEMIN